MLTVGGYGAWRMDRDSTNALFTDNGVTCRDPCSKLGPIIVAFLAALLADGQFGPISLNNFLDFLAMCAQCEEIEREVVGTGLIWMGGISALIWHFIRTSVDDDDDDGETKSDDEDWLCSATDGLYKRI